MADTRPTRISIARTLYLCVLGVIAADRLELEQQKDNTLRARFPGPGPREAPAHLVRRAFWVSLLLVIASAGGGYALGWLSQFAAPCTDQTAISALQIIGAGLLLWGTLFVRGWEIQTYSGVTLVERVNRWLYRAMYCVGTALVVLSLALSPCGTSPATAQAQSSSVPWSTVWAAVGAIATVLAVGAVILAGRQLQFEAWLKAQEIFVEEEFTKARTRLFRHLSDDHLAWDDEAQVAGKLVCRRMDEFCRLAPFLGFFRFWGRAKALKVWADPLGKSWALLEAMVIREREITKWPTKWDAFQSMGNEAWDLLVPEQQTHLAIIAAALRPLILAHMNTAAGRGAV